MPIFNILEDLLSLEVFQYLFMAFAFYGLNLAIKKIIRGGNVI